MATAAPAPALDRALESFEPDLRPASPDVGKGYLDLLGDDDPTGRGPGQRLMVSRALPLIYERLWRPLGGRLLMGALGPDMEGERRLALEMLDPSPEARVLDVACGPGNFTRALARAAHAGLVVGLDASATMLAQAAREPAGGNLAYLRADACALPFRDGSFDAVCCFAALYLIETPMRAIDEMARVLVPGGRIALLSSCNRGPLPTAATNLALQSLTGVRMFGRDELTGALRERGLTGVTQRVAGFGQFVSASKRAGGT